MLPYFFVSFHKNKKTQTVFTDFSFLNAQCRNNTFIICDEYFLKEFSPNTENVFLMKASEVNKSFQKLEEILLWLSEKKANRNSTILAIGGGMVLDIASLCASLYMRGVFLELVPTTLMAMADAALGGKTAVNSESVRNIFGTFYPANTITIDTHFLQTLSFEEYKSGLAEIIKCGLLKDTALLNYLERNSPSIFKRDAASLNHVIKKALNIKKFFIEKDPEDLSLRQKLNLGHTFAHALEKTLGYDKIPHGIAVAFGLRLALDYALKLKTISFNFYEKTQKLLSQYTFPESLAYNPLEVIQNMKSDKKNSKEHIKLILFSQSKKNFLYDANIDLLFTVLTERTIKK